ncbi:MAG: hypothetical protein WCO84_00770 [bacterium]
MKQLPKNNPQKGFIKNILLFIVVLIFIGYFGKDIKKILDSDIVKNNFLNSKAYFGNIYDSYVPNITSSIFELLKSFIRRVNI